MAEALAGAAGEQGMREYYDPRSGDGLGARDFAWSTLLPEMLDPDPAAAAAGSNVDWRLI